VVENVCWHTPREVVVQLPFDIVQFGRRQHSKRVTILKRRVLGGLWTWVVT